MTKTVPRTHSEQIFEELKQVCKPPPLQERRENKWIQPETWALVDARGGDEKVGTDKPTINPETWAANQSCFE